MSSKDEKLLQELCLDLNLDQATAEEVWEHFSQLKVSYTLEGDQLLWLACTVYALCRRKSIPTVGGIGALVEGNGVSLTRILKHCKVSVTDFIRKMKLWLSMSHCEQEFCAKVEMLERNYAVSNNVFIKYKPIFIAIFKDPCQDTPRPPRSRKQRRPPCNATEMFEFCWTLYIVVKAKFSNIPRELVSCYSLLLSCVDLMYRNVVRSKRKDLLNPDSELYAQRVHDELNNPQNIADPPPIMDFLVKKFDGVNLEVKIVNEYYWNPIVRELIQGGLLKGTEKDGFDMLEQPVFDFNFKNLKKIYDEYVLNCGDFDERMFLEGDNLTKEASKPSPRMSHSAIKSPYGSMIVKSATMQDGDHHLMPQTPISSRFDLHNRPSLGKNPLTSATVGLQNLHSLVFRKNYNPKDELLKIFASLKNNPEKALQKLIEDMSSNLTECYGIATSDFAALSPEFIKIRVHLVQVLYYTFLTHILGDEIKRGVDTEVVLHQDIFHKTLFTCCIELVLKAYNDARLFPWSLQVVDMQPYYFFRIIEIVIRVEKRCENYELSRELVKHLKGIEESILDCLAWQSDSPLWELIKKEPGGVPMCADVNYQYNLVKEQKIVTNDQAGAALMSPAVRPADRSASPISSLNALGSPVGQDSARRMLFPSPGVTKKSYPAKRPRPQLLASKLVPLGSDQSQAVSGKPKRGGSFAIFFRKFYTLAHMRLIDLCDRLRLDDETIRLKIWTCFEHSVTHFPHLMLDRHMDQMIMCAIYITLKVTETDRNFQEIMKHYRSQPQASSHIYRSVLISKKPKPVSSMPEREGPPPTPSQMSGTSSNCPSGERGDVIMFYNKVYVQEMKTFAQTLSAHPRGCPAILSPVPNIRRPPVSPRKRVSENHQVFINTMPSSPLLNVRQSPAQPRPYIFNRSPAKDLRVINTVISHGSPRKQANGEPERKRARNDSVTRSNLFDDTSNEHQAE